MTLQELFHRIANHHNKITVSAGFMKEFMQAKKWQDLSSQELDEHWDKLIQVFDNIERYTITAHEELTHLKEHLYEKLGRDYILDIKL